MSQDLAGLILAWALVVLVVLEALKTVKGKRRGKP